MKIDRWKFLKGVIIVVAVIFAVIDVCILYDLDLNGLINLDFARGLVTFVGWILLATVLVYLSLLILWSEEKKRKIVFRDVKKLFYFSLLSAYFLCNILVIFFIVFLIYIETGAGY